MRLLHVETLTFEVFYSDIPKYAIASHRWRGDAETMLRDVQERKDPNGYGFQKVKGFTEYVKKQIPGLQYVWIDTCCIDQTSSAELQEAINSMFDWYRKAEVCLAYLQDVPVAEADSLFERSEWFRRGWTLQELLAPTIVVFLSDDWTVLGHKGSGSCGRQGTSLQVGSQLNSHVAAITKIPENILQDYHESHALSFEEKIQWMAGRRTTRGEDMSYCLLGILSVRMNIRYGDGEEETRKRLINKLGKSTHATMGQQLVVNQLAQLVVNQTSQQTTTKVKPFSSVPFRRDPNYIERVSLLNEIRNKLSEPAGRAVLVGLGGVGKSQLAIEYAQEVRQQSPQTWVFWIHASSASRFDQSIRKITDRLKIPGRQDANADQLQLLQSWLQDEENGKWLVILDNVDDASFLLEPLPTTDTVRRWDHFPPDRHGSMMITSRSKLEALKLVYAEEIIPVTTMSEVEAVALMQRKLGNRDEGINELVRALDCLPLAVTQAASFIRLSGSRYTVHKYREEFELSLESRSSLLESKVPIPNRDKEASNSVFLTWQISFDHVRKIRQSAADLLALMSFCDRSAIPEILIRAQREENAASSGKAKLLCSGGEDVSPARVGMSLSSSDAGDKASSPLDGEKAASGKGEKISLDKRNNVPSSREDQDTPNGRNLTYTDRAIETASENKTSSDNAIEAAPDDVCTSLACNAITFEEDIVMLRSYSFTDETIDSQTWEMHRLVQDATQAWLEAQGSIDDFYGHFLGRFLRSLPKCKIETWPVYRILFPHARRAFVRQPRRRKASLHWASVMHDVARFAVNIGDYSTGEEMAAASVTVRLAHLGNEHKETLWTMATLADTYRVRGRLNEAEQLWVKILQVSEALFNQDPSEILPDLCRYSLSTVYEGQGRFSEAEQLQLQILKSKSELNSAGPPGSLLTLSNLETVHNDPGQYAKAEQSELLVLETTKILAAEDSDTLQLMTRLALTYMYQGRRTEAEQLSLKVLEAKKKVHGVEHSQTLQSMAVLAMVYTVQGRHAEAEHLTLEALEITKRVLGAGHTDTLDLMSHLARIYTDQGRHSEAEQQQLQSLQIQSAVLGEEHPATLTSMHNLANRYHYLKRWQEAEHLEVKVLEGRTVAFGSEHPLTLDSMCSLALAYMMQERLIEAEDLQVKCLETRTAVLGADHQDTLNSAFSLGAVYARQKRFAEALRLTERAAEGYNKVCGMQDNRTVTAMFLLKRLRLRLEQQQRDSVASATSSAIEEGPGIDTEAPVQFARSQQVEDTISAHGESNTLGDQSKGRALWTGMKRLFGKAPKR